MHTKSAIFQFVRLLNDASRESNGKSEVAPYVHSSFVNIKELPLIPWTRQNPVDPLLLLTGICGAYENMVAALEQRFNLKLPC